MTGRIVEISINLIERAPDDARIIRFSMSEQSIEDMLAWLRAARPGERCQIDGYLRNRMKVERAL